jgi:hypothetical protein
MTVASDAREAVRAHPFLHAALRAGVVNYTAAARFLDGGETEAVAAALRRYAEDLPEYDPPRTDARVEMRSGLGPADQGEALLAVGDAAFAPGGGDLTGIVATGDVGPRTLADVLARLHVEDLTVEAAGVAGDALAVVVGRRAGANALRVVEDVLG